MQGWAELASKGLRLANRAVTSCLHVTVLPLSQRLVPRLALECSDLLVILPESSVVVRCFVSGDGRQDNETRPHSIGERIARALSCSG